MELTLFDQRWLPKSVLCLRDYSLNKFLHDLLAGITVGLVALPLAMAFAIASGLTPQAGIYCAVVTGFLVSLLGGSRTQIGGPTGAFVVVVAGITAQHGVDGLFLCTMMAGLLLVILGAIGVWSSTKAAEYAGIKDPQFVVIDEVAGQHLTLVLPLIPIALPNLHSHMDLSTFAIFSALSLVNWKYLLLGFLFFRIFDIWKPFPVRRLENLPGGWGIMADDWMAGVYAAILLRMALHFKLIDLL